MNRYTSRVVVHPPIKIDMTEQAFREIAESGVAQEGMMKMHMGKPDIVRLPFTEESLERDIREEKIAKLKALAFTPAPKITRRIPGHRIGFTREQLDWTLANYDRMPHWRMALEMGVSEATITRRFNELQFYIEKQRTFDARGKGNEKV